MIIHNVKVFPSKIHLPKKKQLAWKIAEIASDNAKLDKEAIEMVINRIIDNASVAIASLNRHPVVSSREMALKHLRKNGATLFGVNSKLKFDCEWAAWSNGTAVRELDFHDTFLAADYSHPGDNIPALISVAQQNKKSGYDLLRGIITAYEVQVNLVKGICLHKHKVDHIAHLGPSVAAGIGSMLKLNTETIYQAVQQALHTTISTRQSRKGEISSWKAYAPAHAGKLAIEAVDRVMRGEGAPSPIYEGEDSVIARILDGKKASYKVPLPKKNETKKAILETYTKEYSAEYQSQALIDLAKKLKKKVPNLNQIRKIDIYTSHHTHYVIGTGANDPQKMDPNASRETLDHSIMYIFAVALEDGNWHHVCCVAYGSSSILYIDGQVSATGGSKTQVTNTSNFMIGGRGTSYGFTGSMSQLCLFDYDLSSTQVSSLYNSGSPRDEESHSGLIAYYTMENYSDNDTTLADDSGKSSPKHL